MKNPLKNEIQGVLAINKPQGQTSFNLVRILRKRLNVKKIGHAGTLDPIATGVMIMLIGRSYTRLSDQLLHQDKEYIAQIKLGASTDSYDCEGTVVDTNDKVPTLEEIQTALQHFQGTIEQVPPMFSAKKVGGKKLYQLARQGKTIERKPITVTLQTTFINYSYPYLTIRVNCSKGTYLRTIAHDLGQMLGCGGHIHTLQRTQSGSYKIEHCINWEILNDPEVSLSQFIEQNIRQGNEQ